MLLNTIVKEEENRVFFEFGGRQPRDGEEREKLPYDQEEGEALIEKSKWEKKNGRRLLNFHYDPHAGGQRPLVEPKGQVVRRGPIVNSKGEVVGFEEGKNLDPKIQRMITIGMWVGEWI